jgi:uncharacterized MAPEG superfamily protein
MTYNYSYHAVPLIFLQVIFNAPRGALIRMRVDNNVNPRLVLDQMEKSGKYSPRLIAKLRRKQSCEANLWEGLPMIIAAIIAGNTAGLSAEYMNAVSASYFVLRTLYGEFARVDLMSWPSYSTKLPG